MWRLTFLVAALSACVVPPPDDRDLPPGVWEPDPGTGRGEVRIAAHGDTVWFGYTRICGESRDCYAPWLVSTSSTGKQLHDPARAGGDGDSRLPVVAVTESTVALAFLDVGTSQPHVRIFDHEGTALRATDHAVRVGTASWDASAVYQLEIVATGDGQTRLVAGFEDVTVPAEVATVDLDPAGDPIGTAVGMGASDDGVISRIAAATTNDGSTVIGWDRSYSNCVAPYRTPMTLTSSVDPGSNVGPVLSVRDLPERGETSPAMASARTTTYVAWETGLDVRRRIALARYPQLDVAVEIGEPTLDHSHPLLALSDPEHGAIMWSTIEPFSMQIAAFEERDGIIVVGPTRTIPRVDPMGYAIPGGLVDVGNGQFVFAWTEQVAAANFPVTRVFATRIDFADGPAETALVETDRVAAPADPRASRVRRRPCSH